MATEQEAPHCVWVVRREPYFDDPVQGVFSSGEKADQFVEQQQRLDELAGDVGDHLPTYDFAQYEIDSELAS